MTPYETLPIERLLSGNPYPGRGVFAGMTPDGTVRIAYFIMGRSANSRNRVFTEKDGAVYTEPFDASKVEDPSLIIYHPVRQMGDSLIVTNGNQTDTIRDMGDFRAALATREYEPDEPNWTPRISAILNADGSFSLSILKRMDGRCLRCLYDFEGVDEGKGWFISTYQGDGSPLPSFTGEPIEIDMPEPEEVWKALNPDNKVSLYTNVNGSVTLFNKNLGD
jgi:IMP cyclohydrolase